MIVASEALRIGHSGERICAPTPSAREGSRMDESRQQSQLYRPLCSRCGTLSTLARVEPAAEPDHDLRTFECPACGHTDVVKVKFR
jgi:predicted RNA-binding Zn-ribbon protein involved in translation (DUF1610 family)